MRDVRRKLAAAATAGVVAFAGAALASAGGTGGQQANASTSCDRGALASILSGLTDPLTLTRITLDGAITESELAELGYKTVCTADGVLQLVGIGEIQPAPPAPAEPAPPPTGGTVPEPAPAPAAPVQPAPPAGQPSQGGGSTAPAPSTGSQSSGATSSGSTSQGSGSSSRSSGVAEDALTREANGTRVAGNTPADGAASREGSLVPPQLTTRSGSSFEQFGRTVAGPDDSWLVESAPRSEAVEGPGLISAILAMTLAAIGCAVAAIRLRSPRQGRHLAAARR